MHVICMASYSELYDILKLLIYSLHDFLDFLGNMQPHVLMIENAVISAVNF